MLGMRGNVTAIMASTLSRRVSASFSFCVIEDPPVFKGGSAGSVPGAGMGGGKAAPLDDAARASANTHKMINAKIVLNGMKPELCATNDE